MPKEYIIKLSADDLGQIIDGLMSRQDSWETTANYLEHGEVPDDTFIMEDCSDHHEARNLSQRYRDLIDTILAQKIQQDQ